MADVRLSTPRLRVILSDDSERVVQCTNADLVRFDLTAAKHKWPNPQAAPFLWLTFIAWAGLKRTGGIPETLTWEDFRDSTLDIDNLTDATGADDSADPTRPEVEPD